MDGFHKLLSLLDREIGQPLTDHVVTQFGALAALTQIDEAVAQHIPRKGFMLQQGHGGTVDDDIVLGVLQKHAHRRGFRDEGVDFLLHAGKSIGFQHRFVETGAVVIIGGHQTLGLQLFRQVDGGVGSQVTAFGVTTDAQSAAGRLIRHLHGAVPERQS